MPLRSCGVIAGRTVVTIDKLGPILPFIESKQLTPLGVTTPRAVSLLQGALPIGDTGPGCPGIGELSGLPYRSGTTRSLSLTR
jgi:hypothetical protein